MKKITLLSIASVLFASIVNAQISKGSVYLGGSIGAYTSNQNNSNTTVEGKQKGISITPSFGIAIKNNLVAGITFSYSNASQKNFINYSDYDNHGLGAGVFVRKFYPLAKKLYFFGEGDLAYGQQKNNYTSGYNSTVKFQNVSASLSAGLTYNIYKSLYIETALPTLISIGYRKETDINTYPAQSSTSETKGVYINSSIGGLTNFSFGLKFIIPKK